MISKIKHKLFFSFLLFSSFSLLTTLASIWLYKKKDHISEKLRILDEVYILSLKSFKVQQEFLTYETINPAFFKTSSSLKIQQHKEISLEILKKINQLNTSRETRLIRPEFFTQFKTEFHNYQNTFYQIVLELLKRGFKDYGLEGEMREYAHALMNIKELNQINILMLRRHEKDFIIRKEDQYIDKFNALVLEVKKEILRSNVIANSRKEKIDSVVNGYSSTFAKLIASEKVLGLKDKSGLNLKLAEQNNFIELLIDLQRKAALAQEKRIFNELLVTALLILLSICAFSFFLSYGVAVALTKPVINLNNYIKTYVNSNFRTIPRPQQRNSKDEISILMHNFDVMAHEMDSYINLFKEKVDERTAEINKQNIEILDQKKKIIDQRDELVVKTEKLEFQQKLLTDKNKNILDSIRYAERIQQAILPSKEIIKKTFPESFIYFEPCNIVSGDFYFVHEKTNSLLFAVADCTGHGVPGAFVSIVGHNALTRTVNEFRLEKPAEILDKLNELVDESFSKQIDHEIRDGMDIAFCSFNITTKLLQYSGANNSLYLIRNNELTRIRADKQPIGRYENRKPFSNHVIELQKDDCIYIFSDGYADQFGGPEGKKFKFSKFKELLVSINNEPMHTQKQLLRDAFESWRGNNEQVDDICIVGARI